MTNETISRRHTQTDGHARQSIVADLAFWSLAGAIVAALSGPLSQWWNAPRVVLLAGGLVFLVGGIGALFELSRRGLAFRRLARVFGMFNLVFAPAMWVTALDGWLPLSAAGNAALGFGGAAALILGVWQLSTARRSRPALSR